MLDNFSPRVKKTVFLILVAIVALVFGWMLYGFLSTASLAVQTDDPSNYVSINEVKSGAKDNTHAKQALYKLSARIKSGTYEISAFNKSFSVTQIIKIKARQSLTFTLNPTKASAPEPVYGGTVSDLTGNSSRLIFLNSNRLLSSIDASNNVTTLSAHDEAADHVDRPLFRAKWASTGLGLVRDSDNKIYIIQANSINPLKLPFSVDENSRVNYDISKNGQIYVSKDKIVYQGNVSGNFKKIYTADKTIAGLAAGINKVAAVTTRSTTTSINPDNTGHVTVINSNGGHTDIDTEAGGSMWSPDSKHLLIKGESNSIVFDSKFKQIADIPADAGNIFVWNDNGSVLYSKSGVLWIYSLTSKQSEKLAIMPAQGLIDGVYPTDDGAYVYVSAQNTGGSEQQDANQLFRIGLKGQEFDNSLVALNVFLPETLSDCLLNYVNLTKPTITITYSREGSQQDCLNLTKAELQTYGLDINKLQYNFQLLVDAH